MPGLIQKSGYIKPGNGGGHYAEYIATREGVELIEAPSPSHDGGGHLEYMAQRPRSHGLFSADGPADLENTMEEINGHTGPVWTFVYSLKREDAHRLGYENSESWRKLLLAHQTELAQAMKISPNSFRWRAAFHDGTFASAAGGGWSEQKGVAAAPLAGRRAAGLGMAARQQKKHHPHVHVMVWSADPKQGFLTEQGIEKMRSRLSNEIFRDMLLSLYQKKICPTAKCGTGGGGHGAAHPGDGDRSVPQSGHRNADGNAGRNAGGAQGQKGLRLPEKADEGAGGRHRG